jgi:hypothetical protein
MVTVTCQDCGRTMEMNEHYVEGMLSTGELVRANRLAKFQNMHGDMLDQYHEGLFDLCKGCRGKAMPRSGDVELMREQRIQHKVKLLREMRPDLDLAARVHAAVDEEFDPKYEPNKAFREFLLERQGL